jgi:hypothetical protein
MFGSCFAFGQTADTTILPRSHRRVAATYDLRGADTDRNPERGRGAASRGQEDRDEKPSVVTFQSPTAKEAETLDANPGGAAREERVSSLDPGIRSRMISLFRQSPGTVAAGSLAVLFAAAYLLAPPMGRDLSAQLAHAQLAASHWPELLDLRWYSGINPLGYSVLSPPVMALLGVRLTTALGYVLCVVLFAELLKRTSVPRPVAGAITAAICLTGNLVITRTTFALGLAVGLAALLGLVAGRLRVTSLFAVLAALASSVAGLFLGIAGGALSFGRPHCHHRKLDHAAAAANHH